MKTILTLCTFFWTLNVTAALSYYSKSIIQKFENQSTSAEELRAEIFTLSQKRHTAVLSYIEARKVMFGDLFLETDGHNHYLVKDVYCNNKVDQADGVGPHSIPNQKVINCEHTWPQSKFSNEFPKDTQKSDLHHIFPVNMKANSTRNNHEFAEVDGKPIFADCPDSLIGTPRDTGAALATDTSIKYFEPPREHRGNVARAIYYFSTRYKMPIPATESHYLKIWSAEDPVDKEELERNGKIMKIQGNRNPFVDYPELVNRF